VWIANRVSPRSDRPFRSHSNNLQFRLRVANGERSVDQLNTNPKPLTCETAVWQSQCGAFINSVTAIGSVTVR
jgi:hypothetical protein